MSKRSEKARGKVKPKYSARRDAFYGLLVGLALASLMPLMGTWNLFVLFGIGYFFWFSLLFFALKVPSKPVQFSRAFYAFLFVVGPAIFGGFVVAVRLFG